MPLIGTGKTDRFPKEDVRLRRSLGRPIYVPYLGATDHVNLGAYSLTGTRFISTEATGIAPLTVASTTVVANLNADLLDGIHASALVPYTGATGNVDLGAFGITAISGTFGAVVLPERPATPTAAADTMVLYAKDANGFTTLHGVDSTGFVYDNFQDNYFIVRNISGADIAKGVPVYTIGATGAIPNIALAKADSVTTLRGAGVTAEAIANNAFGRCMLAGTLEQTDTSAFAEGDALYISPTTAGTWTATRPLSPPYLIKEMARVLASGVGNGKLRIDSIATLGAETGTNSPTWTAIGTVQGTQLISTVAIGTKPITVTSTTLCDNLNADLLDGQHGAYYATAASLASYVPYTGATGAVDLGVHGLTTTGIVTAATFTGVDETLSLTAASGGSTLFKVTNTLRLGSSTPTTIYGSFTRVNAGVGAGYTNTGTGQGANIAVFRNYDAGFTTDSGTIAGLYGQIMEVGHRGVTPEATPQTTTAVGTFIAPYCETGTITNFYGFYLGGVTGAGTVTNHWAIYQTAATAKNYFAGNMGIGAAPGTEKLKVTGDMTATGTITGRMVMRTAASDPKHATPASRPAGIVGEVVYYSAKLYFCTNAATPLWEQITSS